MAVLVPPKATKLKICYKVSYVLLSAEKEITTDLSNL